MSGEPNATHACASCGGVIVEGITHACQNVVHGKDSDHPNIDMLREEARRLYELLENPQPGLFSWRAMVYGRINKIAEFKTIEG